MTTLIPCQRAGDLGNCKLFYSVTSAHQWERLAGVVYRPQTLFPVSAPSINANPQQVFPPNPLMGLIHLYGADGGKRGVWGGEAAPNFG